MTTYGGNLLTQIACTWLPRPALWLVKNAYAYGTGISDFERYCAASAANSLFSHALLESSSIPAAILDWLSGMKVVLLRKLAEESMDGVDVRNYRVGDVLDLPPADARVLIEERWAMADRRRELNLVPQVERRVTKTVRWSANTDDFQRAS